MDAAHSLLSKRMITIGKVCLIVSLLIHLLLLLSFSVSWNFTLTEDERPPGLYIPSYTTQEPQPPSPTLQKSPQKKITDKKGILKNTKPATTSANSLEHPELIPSEKDNEGVHLIGDKNVDKPLITLLGKALSHHLMYPKIAVDFNLRGTVLLRFQVHPDGQITDIQVVHSAGTEVLDRAALQAARQMSPVSRVNQYLAEPKFLVVGIIFG